MDIDFPESTCNVLHYVVETENFCVQSNAASYVEQSR
jgi:hypothetical protein